MSATTSAPISNVVPLSSSSLASVGYDVERTILQIEFRDGSVYQYVDVPAKVHQDLLQADSKGAYFNRYVRKRFLSFRLSRPLPTLG
jgi:KTSC domain